MKRNILKVILVIIVLVGLFYLNQFVFRSDWPFIWFLTSMCSVIGLILFPWKWYFNHK